MARTLYHEKRPPARTAKHRKALSFASLHRKLDNGPHSRRRNLRGTGRLKQRIHEFLGESFPNSPSCEYITAIDKNNIRHTFRTLEELDQYQLDSVEISRSLWDKNSLVVHLDIEYVNFDFPGEAYLNPRHTFALQQPVAEMTQKILQSYGIHALHILSGRGHHFIWQISQRSQAFNELIDIGEGPPSCDQVARQDVSEWGRPSKPLVEAFSGLGLVMEMLAHDIKYAAAPLCRIPVELTAVEVGPGECGREMISIDISEYGDPLESRSIRVPFSQYLKPWQQRDIVGAHVVKTLKSIFMIPVSRLSMADEIRIMRDTSLTKELARRTSGQIPFQEAGMEKLITTYLASSVRIFHDEFYSARHDPPAKWPETYDRIPRAPLPLCALMVLDQPNDLLLRPWGIKLVTRVLLALGWHPRHIAGLIRSKFERDHHWGDLWKGYHPSMRADFYTRVFAGLFMVKHDGLVDFNCQSFKEEGNCPFSTCSNNLDWYRQSAMSRRRYGHLAHRPFNRLFLSKEHL